MLFMRLNVTSGQYKTMSIQRQAMKTSSDGLFQTIPPVSDINFLLVLSVSFAPTLTTKDPDPWHLLLYELGLGNVNWMKRPELNWGGGVSWRGQNSQGELEGEYWVQAIAVSAQEQQPLCACQSQQTMSLTYSTMACLSGSHPPWLCYHIWTKK